LRQTIPAALLVEHSDALFSFQHLRQLRVPLVKIFSFGLVANRVVQTFVDLHRSVVCTIHLSGT
jgi:hypothetical protein